MWKERSPWACVATRERSSSSVLMRQPATTPLAPLRATRRQVSLPKRLELSLRTVRALPNASSTQAVSSTAASSLATSSSRLAPVPAPGAVLAAAFAATLHSALQRLTYRST